MEAGQTHLICRNIILQGLNSKYKHLGKAGSQAYMNTIEQMTARTKIEALDR
jgi:hypothetical protein